MLLNIYDNYGYNEVYDVFFDMMFKLNLYFCICVICVTYMFNFFLNEIHFYFMFNPNLYGQYYIEIYINIGVLGHHKSFIYFIFYFIIISNMI